MRGFIGIPGSIGIAPAFLIVTPDFQLWLNDFQRILLVTKVKRRRSARCRQSHKQIRSGSHVIRRHCLVPRRASAALPQKRANRMTPRFVNCGERGFRDGGMLQHRSGPI